MKNKKVIILMLAVVTALVLSVGTFTASAETKEYAVTGLWSTNSTAVVTEVGAESGLKLTLPNSTAATYKNNLDFTAFDSQLTFADANIKKFEIRLTGASDFDTNTVNKLVVTYADGDTTKFLVTLNDNEATEITASTGVHVTYDASTAKFTFNTVEVTGTAKAYVWNYGVLRLENTESDQNVVVTVDGINGETFAKTDVAGAVADSVDPVVLLPENLNKFTDTDKISLPVGLSYSLKVKGLDVIGEISTTVTCVPNFQVGGQDIKEEDRSKYRTVSGTSVMFKVAGEYTVTVKVADDAGKTTTKEIVFTAVDGADTTAPYYDPAKIDDYQAKLTALEDGLKMSEKLYLPLPAVIDDYTATNAMRYLVRTMSPTSSTWSTFSVTSGKPYFTPSVVGTYRVQIVPVDLCENVADYNTCPEFRLTVVDTTAPTVTVTLNELQYTGTEIKLNDISVTEASDYKTVSKLEKYDDATAEWTLVENISDKFYPENKDIGKYKLTVTVKDKYLNETAVIKTFEVKKSSVTSGNKKGKSWAEQNVLSIVFGSIAVLCVVGLVVLEVIYKKKQKDDSAE